MSERFYYLKHIRGISAKGLNRERESGLNLLLSLITKRVGGQPQELCKSPAKLTSAFDK